MCILIVLRSICSLRCKYLLNWLIWPELHSKYCQKISKATKQTIKYFQKEISIVNLQYRNLTWRINLLDNRKIFQTEMNEWASILSQQLCLYIFCGSWLTYILLICESIKVNLVCILLSSRIESFIYIFLFLISWWQLMAHWYLLQISTAKSLEVVSLDKYYLRKIREWRPYWATMEK